MDFVQIILYADISVWIKTLLQLNDSAILQLLFLSIHKGTLDFKWTTTFEQIKKKSWSKTPIIACDTYEITVYENTAVA